MRLPLSLGSSHLSEGAFLVSTKHFYSFQKELVVSLGLALVLYACDKLLYVRKFIDRSKSGFFVV
jgi:hypothetical protein